MLFYPAIQEEAALIVIDQIFLPSHSGQGSLTTDVAYFISKSVWTMTILWLIAELFVVIE